jgi:hypothetical protein
MPLLVPSGFQSAEKTSYTINIPAQNQAVYLLQSSQNLLYIWLIEN